MRLSTATGGVKVSEQKVKVGRYQINYVKSFVPGTNPKNTLICLPGALGEIRIYQRII